MQKERPCIIIQNDIGNKNSPNTIVIPITHNNTNLPFIISLQPQYESDGTTIKLDGQANISHIRSISKARLGNYITNLPQSEMKKIDAAIASNIDLMKYYSKIQKQYQDKLQYINKIKQDRNIAQDTLKEIRKILNISDESDIIQEVQKLNKKMVDTFLNTWYYNSTKVISIGSRDLYGFFKMKGALDKLLFTFLIF